MAAADESARERRMTLATKRRLVAGGLIVLALWPLAHRVLVARFELDPWRFFGWAMYCTPKLPVRVHLFAVTDGQRERIEIRTLKRRVRRAVYALPRRRAVFGRLASPAPVGRLLLAARPRAEAVEIEIERWTLDPATASIVDRRTVYRYAPTAAPP